MTVKITQIFTFKQKKKRKKDRVGGNELFKKKYEHEKYVNGKYN